MPNGILDGKLRGQCVGTGDMMGQTTYPWLFEARPEIFVGRLFAPTRGIRHEGKAVSEIFTFVLRYSVHHTFLLFRNNLLTTKPRVFNVQAHARFGQIKEEIHKSNLSSRRFLFFFFFFSFFFQPLRFYFPTFPLVCLLSNFDGRRSLRRRCRMHN